MGRHKNIDCVRFVVILVERVWCDVQYTECLCALESIAYKVESDIFCSEIYSQQECFYAFHYRTIPISHNRQDEIRSPTYSITQILNSGVERRYDVEHRNDNAERGH